MVFQSINKPAGIMLLAHTMVANGALNGLLTEKVGPYRFGLKERE